MEWRHTNSTIPPGTLPITASGRNHVLRESDMSQGPFQPNPQWGGQTPQYPPQQPLPGYGGYPPQPNPYGGYPAQQPPAIPNPYGNYAGGPAGGWSSPPPRKSKLPFILGILGGSFVLAVFMCVGFVTFLFSKPTATASAKQPYNVASIAVPPLPERGEPVPSEPQVVVYTPTILNRTGGFYSPPGHGGRLHVYLPAGEHAQGSLPCVLICGAGSTLLHGMELSDIEEEGDSDEHFPYARAGIAVVAYELDGPSESFGELPAAKEYEAFRAACAGVVNARNALEFVLAKLPEVNPRQIFAAGHSSAGTAALLFAAHEPRLAGCIAYAPCTDLESRFPGIQVRIFSAELNGLPDFLCQSSPLTHVGRIRCPTFLFHAEDDSVCEIAETQRFQALLQAQGTPTRFLSVPTGEHYDSMIEQGIPAGIAFIKERIGK